MRWTTHALQIIGLAGIVSLGASRVVKADEQFAAAETAYVDGNIYTLNPNQPRAEAMAMAGGRILAVGSMAAISHHLRDTTTLHNLAGHTVLPGLIDAHAHMSGLGSLGFETLDLTGTESYQDVIRNVRERAARIEPGKWITGRGWDHEDWAGKKLPTHADLSAAVPNHPVWIRRVDGHAGLANALAMRIAGVTAETTAPEGGAVIHDDGRPTGVFVDNAMDLIERHVDDASASPEDLLLRAQERCLSVGLTGVHDAGISLDEIAAYQKLAADGRLKIRIYAMLNADIALDYYRQHEPIIGDRFTLRACKLYADGALGSRGAWMLKPYSDRPTDDEGMPYTGLPVNSIDFLTDMTDASLRAGFQVCTHAIGDRANREMLDIYSRATKTMADTRPRIEHAQIVSPADLARFAESGVIASMQPTHATSDMPWVEARMGKERLPGAYAWASLLRQGAHLAFGSDFPVESNNPFLGLYAAVTRQDPEGQPTGGWLPDQHLTREEALRAFTLGAAHAAFEENFKGSLEPGKLADFIVIDRDIMTCPAKDIPKTRVLQTIINGRAVFEAIIN